MAKQIYHTENSHGLSAFKPAVWNPLDFLAQNAGSSNLINLDVQTFVEIEHRVDQVLADLGITPKHVEPEKPTTGMEVGDDRADWSSSNVNLARELVVQEFIFKMKTSWKDTFLSKDAWNFCEVTSAIPASPCESLNYCRKAGTLRNLGFTDAAVLRLIGNVQKGDRSHSSSATGKASMLGRRMETPRESNRHHLMLASWLQDGCLNTAQSPEPKYLHGILGGSGCPPLWDNPRNTYMYVLSYKGGSYERVYGTAINELRNVVGHLDQGLASTAILCERLREKQEYMHSTYAQNVVLPPRAMLAEGGMLPPLLYKASGASAAVQGTERRLIATKRVLTRSQANVEVLRTQRICDALLGLIDIGEQERNLKSLRREQTQHFELALRANSAVQRLLARCANGTEVTTLVQEGFLTVGVGVKHISYWDIEWLTRGGKGEIYTIEDITKSEDMFVRSEVSVEETMKVPGLQIDARMSAGNIYQQTTVAKVGLWQVSLSLEAWADSIVSDLIAYREHGLTPGRDELLLSVQRNREWVADDPLIMEAIAKIAREDEGPVKTILIMTSDQKLCRQIAKNVGYHIICVPPESVIRLIPKDHWEASDNLSPEQARALLSHYEIDRSVPAPEGVFMDVGSFSAAAMKLEQTLNPLGQPTGTLQKTEFIYTERSDGFRKSRVKKHVITREVTLRAKVFAANGTERWLHLRQPQRMENPLEKRKRSLTSFLPKFQRKKGG